MLDRSKHVAGLAARKRDSAHLIFNSPLKRLKSTNQLDVAGPSSFKSVPKGDSAGRAKAEKWFEDTDKHASRDVSFPDNDPPFYINRRSLSDGSSVCAVRSDGTSLKHSTLGKPTAPTKALLARMESNESGSEEFRSVIDDLTVQNKRLKKKLRQYERLHCSHLQDDKMFEVRIHGLDAHQKRELEETLRSFASSIGESSPERRPTINHPSVEQTVGGSGRITHLKEAAVGAIPMTESLSTTGKPSPASTTGSKPLDSTYASMSGKTGTSQLHPREKGVLDNTTRATQTQQNVNPYLHDVSKTLVPKHSMAMSARSKSKLVVKRLEQIFTGRSAPCRQQMQSDRQPEASHFAAQPDQNRFEIQGRGRQPCQEGVRTAQIRGEVDLELDSLSVTPHSRQSSNDGRASIQGTRDNSPGQRPTRPLDLDLNRAQVPEENMDYIRHLNLPECNGFISPDADEGWVYLNLLISMAQLHTLSVTPEFIRNAVANVSSRFELSADGTKVRWLGGTEATILSSDSGDSSDVEGLGQLRSVPSANRHGSPPSMLSALECMDRNEPISGPTHESLTNQDVGTKQVPAFLAQANNAANFHYKPLLVHGAPSEQDDDSGLASDSGISSDVVKTATGMYSGINSGSHGLRETEVNLRIQNAEKGPIIFYHKARFCTDLSGDPQEAHIDNIAYHRLNEDPIGCPSQTCEQPQAGSTENSTDSMGMDCDSINASGSDLGLDDLKSCISECFSPTGSSTSMPLPLEVSGLGGVHPDDNFVVKVNVRHCDRRRSPHDSHRTEAEFTRYRRTQRLERSIIEAKDSMQSHPIEAPSSSEIVSVVKSQMKPSTVPSPLRYRSSFTSSESEDKGSVQSRVMVSPYNSKSRSSDAARPDNVLATSIPRDNSNSSYASTSVGSDDDSSIDLLAHARELDPDAVAAREREFDINLLPAGSVAATAGQSSSGLVRPLQQASSEADSMSVDEDGLSRMADSNSPTALSN